MHVIHRMMGLWLEKQDNLLVLMKHLMNMMLNAPKVWSSLVCVLVFYTFQEILHFLGFKWLFKLDIVYSYDYQRISSNSLYLESRKSDLKSAILRFPSSIDFDEYSSWLFCIRQSVIASGMACLPLPCIIKTSEEAVMNENQSPDFYFNPRRTFPLENSLEPCCSNLQWRRDASPPYR